MSSKDPRNTPPGSEFRRETPMQRLLRVWPDEALVDALTAPFHDQHAQIKAFQAIGVLLMTRLPKPASLLTAEEQEEQMRAAVETAEAMSTRLAPFLEKILDETPELQKVVADLPDDEMPEPFRPFLAGWKKRRGPLQ
jgi:hypothetical protein